MTEENNSMSMNQHFLRQRRNLFSSGLALLLLIFFGKDNSSITNSFITGISIPVIYLVLILAGFFIYFSIRYISYFISDDIQNNLYIHHLTKNYVSGEVLIGQDYKFVFIFGRKLISIIKDLSSVNIKFKEISKAAIKSKLYEDTKNSGYYEFLLDKISFKDMYFSRGLTVLFDRKYGDYLFPIVFMFLILFILVLLMVIFLCNLYGASVIILLYLLITLGLGLVVLFE